MKFQFDAWKHPRSWAFGFDVGFIPYYRSANLTVLFALWTMKFRVRLGDEP